ncbi:uncharacterized protein LOC131317385 [Rhododendron vialii]|uniref:uncharacterized protein LOC131317385 n=1 Tax=Rhododendron vialii TaxID=182163 RepID=UPI00265DE871|nr:uncharacterized protein LOC131317385 [Rhododendron vialii]
MRACVFWTIHDFPAYGMMSRWSTKGYLACPICNCDFSSVKLRSKIGYLGAHCWLPENHIWRRSKLFNGKFQDRTRPVELWKNKDTEKACKDLEDQELRKELDLKSKRERRLCNFLKSIKYPDGYAANISKCVNTRGGKLSGLKSHDCHVLLQRLLLIVRKSDLDKLQENIILVLCKFEKIFPPAFFDVMAYVCKECTTFCSMYLDGIETVFNRQERNDDGGEQEVGLKVFTQQIRPFSIIPRAPNVPVDQRDMAHWFVLNNSLEVEPYLEYVNELRKQGSPEATNELWSMANGPEPIINTYSGCISNGVRFLTIEWDNRHTTQNSGVVVEGEHEGQTINFYGFLTKVWEMAYLFGHRVVLFQCEWYNSGCSRFFRVDTHCSSIDVRSRWYKDDPFVFPSQVQQVFYIADTELGEHWKVVERIHH